MRIFLTLLFLISLCGCSKKVEEVKAPDPWQLYPNQKVVVERLGLENPTPKAVAEAICSEFDDYWDKLLLAAEIPQPKDLTLRFWDITGELPAVCYTPVSSLLMRGFKDRAGAQNSQVLLVESYLLNAVFEKQKTAVSSSSYGGPFILKLHRLFIVPFDDSDARDAIEWAWLLDIPVSVAADDDKLSDEIDNAIDDEIEKLLGLPRGSPQSSIDAALVKLYVSLLPRRLRLECKPCKREELQAAIASANDWTLPGFHHDALFDPSDWDGGGASFSLFRHRPQRYPALDNPNEIEDFMTYEMLLVEAIELGWNNDGEDTSILLQYILRARKGAHRPPTR